jgi:hypothetical protein
MIATAAPNRQHRHVRADLRNQTQDHELQLPYIGNTRSGEEQADVVGCASQRLGALGTGCRYGRSSGDIAATYQRAQTTSAQDCRLCTSPGCQLHLLTAPISKAVARAGGLGDAVSFC